MKPEKKVKGRASLLDEQKETRAKIGTRLRDLRKSKGLSQETFANQFELDRTQVSRIERGISNIEINTLVKFVRALDVTIIEFFAGMN